MPPSETHQSSSVTFRGLSGERYFFQAWPIATKFKPIGGVYVFTSRTFEDKTFTTKASHHVIAIGQTSNLASAASEAERRKLDAQAANCICVCAVEDEARRAAIEKDLMDGNERWGGRLQYLFHPETPQKSPGTD